MHRKRIHRKGWCAGAAALALLLPLAAQATLFNYTIGLSGANEVNIGDSDGFGTAVITIDDSTAPFPTINWNITVGNLALPPTGAHIHQGVAGVNGSVRIDFSGQLTGSGLQDADLAGVIAQPSGWYVNVHTAEFPGGAIRGQVPEPTTALLLAGGLALLAGRRA